MFHLRCNIPVVTLTMMVSVYFLVNHVDNHSDSLLTGYLYFENQSDCLVTGYSWCGYLIKGFAC